MDKIPVENHSKEEAFENACIALRKNNNIENICKNSGAKSTDNGVKVNYFGTDYSIGFPDMGFTPTELSLAKRTLVLHYLTVSEPVISKNQFVSFKDLPGGMFYYPTVKRNSTAIILEYLGNNPEKLLESSLKLGGREESSTGDITIRFTPLPRVDILLIFYKADDEFPAGGSLLLKQDITSYLSLKDIERLLCEFAIRLVSL